MDIIKKKFFKQKRNCKAFDHDINNIKQNKNEKNMKSQKEILRNNYKINSNSQNSNILKIINLCLSKNVVSNNILIITLIVIFYPIIIFNKNIKELRKLYSFSEVILTIKGKGEKFILHNEPDKNNKYFDHLPSEVYINDKIINTPGYKVNLTEEINIVKIRWNYTLTNCNLMFYTFDYITEIDLSNFDSSQVTCMLRMFQGCTSLTSINYFSTKSSKDLRNMFAHCSSLISLDLSNFDTSSVTKIDSIFYNCTLLKSLDLSNFDTSEIISMPSMFYGCSSLTSLDLNNFRTSLVKDMSNMFKDCSSLKYLDIDNFDTSSVTNMDRTFSGCRNLISLNIGNFDTSKVKDMYRIFYNCKLITSFDLKNFDTSLVTRMSGMFYGCSSLLSLNLNNFITSNVNNMNEMFKGCTSLIYLHIDNFITSNVNSMSEMFSNCKSLLSLNLSNFETTNLKTVTSMFSGCNISLIFCMDEKPIRKIVKELNSTNPDYINNCSYFLVKENNKIIENENNDEDKDEDEDEDEDKVDKNKKCSTIDFLKNLCKINNNINEENTMINNIRNEITNHSLDSLLENIFIGEKNDILVENQNRIYQLTSSDNQNNKKYYNVSTIKLGECEKELKDYYKMGDNDSLLIFKVDYYNESFTTPIVEYEIYNYENKQRLNLSICQNIPIEIDIPVSIDEDNIFKYNLSSDYYNDRCYPYTTEQGTQILF